MPPLRIRRNSLRPTLRVRGGRGILAASILAASASSSLGGTVSFTGTGTSWNQATDWSPALPTSNDDVLFSNGFATTLDGLWLVRSLSFNAGSGTVSIDANATGTGTTSRTLVLSGDAGGSDALGNSGMLIDLGSATTGTVNIGVTNGVGITSVTLGDNGAFNIGNASATLNFGANSNISGAVNVTQSGAGTLILAGANSFGGAGNSFTLLGGTLDINNASALGNSANTFVINGGTIDNTSGAAITTLNYAQTWAGSFTFNGTNALNLGTGAVALTSSPVVTVNGSGANGTLTVGGVISGAQSLTKSGTGTLVLTGANTYTGGTNVNAGTLLIGGGGATGSISGNSITVALGATLAYNYSTAFTATPVSVAGNVSYTSAAALTLPAGTYGGNQITATGTNVVVGGNLTLNAGAGGVSISGTSSSAAGVTSTTSRNITATGNVTITGKSTAGSFIDGISLAGAYTDTTGTLTFVGTAGSGGAYGIECGVSGSWAGTISTFGNVVFDGTGGTTRNSDVNTGNLSGNGTVTLIGRLKGLRSSATFTASGGLPYNVVLETTGSAGINGLLGSGTDTTGNGNYTINSAGTVVFGGRTVNAGTGTISLTSATGYSVTSNSSLIGGTLTMGDTTGIAISSGATLTLNATGTIPNVISGSGNITVAGGTITFGGANTYTGTTSIGAGTLNLDFSASGTPSSNIISSASAFVTSGGTLVITGSSSAANMQSFASTAVNPGASSVRLTTNGTSAQDVALNLGGITHNVGGTVNFTQPSGTISTTNGFTTTSGSASTILTDSTTGGAYATVGGTDWAAISAIGGNIVGLSTLTGSNGYTAFSTAGTVTLTGNADLTTGTSGATYTLAGNSSPTTIRDIGTAVNISIPTGTTLSSGGILSNQNMTISGGGTVMAGAGGSVGELVVNQTANTSTINAVIGDNGGSLTSLTKSGAGTLTLTAANTYSGATTLNAGTLNINTPSALGNAGASNIFTIGGGAIDNTSGAAITTSNYVQKWAGSFTFTGSNALNLGTGTVTLTASPTITVSGSGLTVGGVISGAFGLTKAGNGTLVLSGANTYSGGTSVNAGALKLDLSARSGGISIGPIAVSSGAILELFNTNTGIDATLFQGPTNVSGNGTLNKTGAGYLDFWNNSGTQSKINAFTGQINVQAGCLATNGSDWSSSATMSINISSGTFFDVRTGSVGVSALTGSGTIGSSSSGSSTLTVGNGNNSSTFGGVIQNNLSGFSGGTGSGAITIVKTGTGTLALTGANTYTGTTTINGGTLEFAGNGLPAASAMTVNAGTLQIDTAGKSLMSLTVNNPSAGLVLPAMSGQTTTVTGAFTASANYSVMPLFGTLPTAGSTFNLLTAGSIAGGGTASLNPNTPFGPTRVTGSLAVAGNTLQYTVATGAATLVWNNHAANGTWNVASDANFNNGGSNDVFKVYDAVTFDDSTSAGGTVTLAGLLAPSSVTVNTVNSYTFAGSGSISGAGTLTKNGTGILTIGAANNYGGGTTLNAGQINLNNASAIGAGTFNIAGGVIDNTSGHAVTLASNPQIWSGDFTFGGSNALNLGRGAVTLTANRTLTVNGSLTVGGAISGSGFGLTKTGPGTLVLTNTSTYTGTTTVSAGTLQLGNGVSNGSVAGGIANNGTLIFANPAALTYSGVISGNGGVVFSGPGAIALATAANTYAGGTTITGGTVNLGSNGNENAAALGTGPVSLGSGTILWMQPGSTSTAYNIANALNINGGTIRGEDGVQHLQGPVAIGALGGILQATWGGKDLYVDGLLSGSAALTLSHGTTGGQAAAIHITNASNTYSGTVNVSGAGNGITLDLDNPTALQYASVNLNPGTAGAMLLTNTNGATIAGLTSSSGGSVKPATTAGTYTLTINNSGNFSYAGTLADNTGILALTKNGTGTQTLTGAATYSGPTLINAGTLALVGSASLASQSITIAPGGVLDVSALSSGAFSLGTGQSLTAGKSSGTGNDIVGNLSTGTGSLNVSISGTLSLKGDLSLNGGTVNLNLNNSTTGGSGLNDLINAANLNLSGPTSFSINTGTSALVAGTYTIVQYSGSLTGITDNLSVLVDGSPSGTTRTTCTVGTTGSTNGALTLTVIGSTASLVWAGDNATNAWDAVTTPNFLNNGARDMFYQADAVTFNDSGSNSPTIAITGTVNPGSVTVNNSATAYTFGGTGSIAGSAALTKSGNGTLTIANANTYTGGTTLNAGQLNINNALALGTGPLVVAGGTIDNTSGAPITLASNNPQTWTGNFTFGGSNALNLGTGAVNLGASTTVTVNGDSTTPLTVGGPISGTYGLTKEGPGTLALTSNGNSYTGNVTVNGGILQTGTRAGNGTTGSLGANSTTGRTITVNSGAQLQFLIGSVFGSGSQPLANIPAVIINGGTVSSTNYNIIGNVTLNSGATLTQSAAISGKYQGWEFSNGSTVTVGGTSGSTISSTGTAGDHLDQAVTFNVASTGDTAPDLTVSVNLLNASGDNGSVAGGFTKTGAGTMLLSAANTYTGPTVVKGGTLQVAGSIAGTPVTVNNGGTLVVAGTASGSSATVSGGTLSIPAGGTLSDTLTVTSGTVQVAGSLSGSTAVVNGGSLIGAQGGTIGSAVTVSSGLLGGDGVVSGAVTVNSGGTVAPGQNASGYLTLNNGLALNSGGHLALALDGTGFTAQYAPTYVTGGTVALGGDLQLTLGYTPTIGDVFFVIVNQGPSAIGGMFSNAADQGNGTGLLSAGGYNFLVSYTASYGSGAFGVNQGQDVALKVIAIPEPSAAIALLGGLGALAGLQRFRRRGVVKNL